MGLFSKKTAPDKNLQEHGVRGTGYIEHVEQPRFGMEMTAGRGSAEKMLSGEETPFKKKMRMRIEVPGREPYVVTETFPVPMMKSGMVTAGATVTVLVDPGNPKRVAIDWTAPIERGSAREALNDSPLAMKALEGMGLDVDALMRQADEARERWNQSQR